MSTFAILIGLALTAQVTAPPRYPDANAAAQPGANSQKGTASVLDDYGAQGSNNQPAGVAPIYPPAATGQGSGVYSGLSNGAANGATTPANNNPLGGVYSPGKMQPPSNAGGGSQLGGNFSGNAPAQTGANRDLNPPPANGVRTDTARAPAGIMRAMLAAPANSRLSGEWVTLDEVVAGATSRAEQSERVEAYWDLCSSVADYFLGLREQGEMARLKQSSMPRISAAMDEAEKDLTVRVGTAERGARASQLRLASLTGRGPDRLPLPAHSPHCGSYQTRHQQVFAGRSSTEADELSELIPLRYAELQDACAAVTRLEDWFAALAASRAGAVDEEIVLRSLELLALQRRAFVQIARDYNRRISRYVELAAPGQVEPDRLIGMLIKRDRPATATRSSSDSPPSNRQTQTGPDGRQTFAAGNDGWMSTEGNSSSARRDEAVTPASADMVPNANEPGEHSLLVPKR